VPSPGRGLQHDDAVRGGRIAEPLERRSEATVRVSVHDQFSVTDTCTLSELVFEVVKRSICEIVPSQALIVAFRVGSLGRLICPPCRLGRGRFAALTSTLEAAHEGEIGGRRQPGIADRLRRSPIRAP
jgi:hypothetical protein